MPQFEDIILVAGRQKKRGELKWSDSQSLIYQSKGSTKPVTIQPKDIESYTWGQQYDGFCWKLHLKLGTDVKFSGFPSTAKPEVDIFVKENGKELDSFELSTKGNNSGQFQISGMLFICETSY